MPCLPVESSTTGNYYIMSVMQPQLHCEGILNTTFRRFVHMSRHPVSQDLYQTTSGYFQVGCCYWCISETIWVNHVPRTIIPTCATERRTKLTGWRWSIISKVQAKNVTLLVTCHTGFDCCISQLELVDNVSKNNETSNVVLFMLSYLKWICSSLIEILEFVKMRTFCYESCSEFQT